jgi:hypothetical protein
MSVDKPLRFEGVSARKLESSSNQRKDSQMQVNLEK